MMSLEEEFDKARTEWKRHIHRVSYSSNPGDYVNCEPFRRIVSLGPKILPYIRKDLEEPMKIGKAGFFWLHAIHDLFGDKFSIPEEIRGKTKELIEYTINWIDQYNIK